MILSKIVIPRIMVAPSLDPVLLVKIPLIQCFYGIRSMKPLRYYEVNTLPMVSWLISGR